MQIEGKVAIVTGSAKRVGKAILLALAKRGARVIVNYRSSRAEAEATFEEARSLGAEALLVRADVSTGRGAGQLVSAAADEFGRVDILVNNASIYHRTPFGRITERDWDSHLTTNLKAPFMLSHQAAMLMRRQRAGKIVNIIDADVTRPYPHYLPYLVSKSGLVGLTYCLAKELAPNIQVNAIAPGPVILRPHWGPKVKRAIIAETPLRRIGSPDDIANAVLFCVEGTDFMTGAIIPVDGGQHVD